MEPAEAFGLLDLRVGRVQRAEPNEGRGSPPTSSGSTSARSGRRPPAPSSPTCTRRSDLVGRLVVAAVNLGTRRVNGFPSEVLVLGLPDAEGRVVLLAPERDVPVGGRVY